jgi:HK97 family phage prohead protease
MNNKLFLTKEAPAGLTKRLNMAFKAATVDELKAIGEDDLPEGYVAGWASTPDLDLYSHVVEPNAFAKSITAKGLTGPRGIKLLAQHDMGKPAGVIKKLEYRGGALWIEAAMNLKISYVRDLYEAAKMNGGLSFSVGFSLDEDGYEFKKDKNKNEYLSITSGDLFEVSVVTLPGNEAAEMLFIKGIKGEEVFSTVADLEKALVASGVAKSRNAAHEFILAVKKNLHLFRDETPVLASTKTLDDLSAVLVKLREAIENN